MQKKIWPLLAFTAFILLSFSMTPNKAAKWLCKPCGSDCDKEIHSGPGECEHCHMPLVEEKTIQFKNIPLSQICKKLSDPALITVDVRTVEEFNGTAPDKFGRIRNAINIPIQELETRIDELTRYKNKEILVYCSHSHRSPQAAWILNQHGFKKVDNMSGGMSVWGDSVHCDSFRIK